jgi:hypothetical protein
MVEGEGESSNHYHDFVPAKGLFRWLGRCTVHFPNSVGKILPLFVLTSTRLFYIRSKVFFQIGILQILLFQMIYCLSLIFHIFMVKLSVYENVLHPTELGGTSLILSASRKMSLILRLLIKYIEKLNF